MSFIVGFFVCLYLVMLTLHSDLIFETMIPANEHLSRPIALRHPFIFYMGHLPGFRDIQLSRALDEPVTSPTRFAEIFERGMDPCVENPTICHAHSAVPDRWPDATEVKAYRDATRERLRKVHAKFTSVSATPAPDAAELSKISRILWMVYEHDAMHIETLLYMLTQYPGVHPPKHFAAPIGLLRALTEGDVIESIPAAGWVKFGPAESLWLGHNDVESDVVTDPQSHEYGWDNESPRRRIGGNGTVAVPAFEIQDRPVTVAEYATFLASSYNSSSSSFPSYAAFLAAFVPKSWSDDGKQVKTVFGEVPLARAGGWPVFVSHTQAVAYIAWRGDGLRLPTEPELLLAREASNASAPTGNYGFRSWVPEDVREGVRRRREAGRQGLEVDVVGDGWEWTDTVFEAHEGFEASKFYPGYSSDFL